MARNRVIYQSEALYVSKNVISTGSGEHYQLRRVQSANYNFSIDRKDVNQFGQLARIDALILKSPTVGLDFSYYPTDGLNEKALGFYINTGQGEGNFASGQMGASSGQNFYIVTTDEGQDLNTTTGDYALSGKNTIAIGNGFLSNYTFDASVGNIPTVKVTVEGLNMQSSTIVGRTSANSISGNFVLSPAIDPTAGSSKGLTGSLKAPTEATGDAISNGINALRPGDITLDLNVYKNASSDKATPIASLGSINVQSASLSLPLSRTPIEKLGSRFAYVRVVDFPIVSTLNVSAVLSDIEARNLATMLDDTAKREVTLTIKKPGADTTAIQFKLKGTQLKSESFSSSIGSNKTVDLVFETQIGGPTDTNNGLYVCGSFSTGDANTNVSGLWAY